MPEPKMVLIMDDERDILRLVAWALEAAGYRVQTAANGREGLEVVRRERPDLIVLDMKMPQMDGWQFAREFEAVCDSPMPIVVLTAAANAKQCADEIGAIGWIGKPFDLDTLVSLVRRYVGTA